MKTQLEGRGRTHFRAPESGEEGFDHEQFKFGGAGAVESDSGEEGPEGDFQEVTSHPIFSLDMGEKPGELVLNMGDEGELVIPSSAQESAVALAASLYKQYRGEELREKIREAIPLQPKSQTPLQDRLHKTNVPTEEFNTKAAQWELDEQERQRRILEIAGDKDFAKGDKAQAAISELNRRLQGEGQRDQSDPRMDKPWVSPAEQATIDGQKQHLQEIFHEPERDVQLRETLEKGKTLLPKPEPRRWNRYIEQISGYTKDGKAKLPELNPDAVISGELTEQQVRALNQLLFQARAYDMVDRKNIAEQERSEERAQRDRFWGEQMSTARERIERNEMPEELYKALDTIRRARKVRKISGINPEDYQKPSEKFLETVHDADNEIVIACAELEQMIDSPSKVNQEYLVKQLIRIAELMEERMVIIEEQVAKKEKSLGNRFKKLFSLK